MATFWNFAFEKYKFDEGHFKRVTFFEKTSNFEENQIKQTTVYKKTLVGFELESSE